ncbi:MAG: M23 family metallopeptidase [Candidatus Dormibacterales bacterium]
MGPPGTGVVARVAGRLAIPALLACLLALGPLADSTTAPGRLLRASPLAVTRAGPTTATGSPDLAGRSLGALEAEVAALDGRIAALDRAIPGQRAEVGRDRDRLRTLARAIYVEPTSLLAVVGEAQSLAGVLDGLAQVSAMGAAAHELEVSLVQAARLLAQEKRRRYGSIDLRARLYAQLVGLSSARVWQQITAWVRANSDLTLPADPAHSRGHRFVWPVGPAVISQGFGPTQNWREPPYQGWAHFHTGVDLEAPYGTLVRAADDGIVIATGYDPFGYGRYVVLGGAGGMATLYGHLSALSVAVGAQVMQGQALGREGSTGNSTGPHLHLEVRVDFGSVPGGRPVDPTQFLPPGPPSPPA